MQLWKTHARRIAALVCTLAMTACLLPSAAFATGAEPADSLPVEQPVEETAPAEVPAETPAETEVPAEALTETAAPEATPAETEAPAEEPAAAETPIEEPTETEAPAETPAEPAEPAETPAATEAPEETEAPAEEPAAVQAQAETADPEVTDMQVTYDETAVAVQNQNGSFIVSAANTTDVTDYTVTLTLSDGAAFTAPAEGTMLQDGDMYVYAMTDSTVTLRINQTAPALPMDEGQLDLVLNSTGSNTWSGSFANAEGISLDTLGSYLSGLDLRLVAGSLGTGSQAREILVNHDDANTMLILCAPDATINTITYVVDGSTTFTGKYVSGMTVAMPSVALNEGETIAWYLDADFTTDAGTTVAVDGDKTLYAQVTAPETPDPDPDPDPTPNDFESALTTGQPATIDSMDDWNFFVANSSSADAGQLITLSIDIDCNNATYQSMTFAGDFDGGNHTISNATFQAGTAPSGESSNGMFVKIGAGQLVVNLNLSNVTVSGLTTEYAGTLAGMVDGHGAVIQNVQVYGGSVSGRSVGGVVGFLRNATVRYCSSRDTTVTGVANGGGVIGLNNGRVEYSFSTSTPTALPSFLGGSAGGVIGKNVRGGNGDYCWAYMQVLGSSKDGGGTVAHELVANANMDFATFFGNGFEQLCWTFGDGMPADFDSTVVTYNFATNS